MTFKNYLNNTRGQSALEYIMVFVVIAVGALIVFASFSPDEVRFSNNEIRYPAIKAKNVLGQAVDKLITNINDDPTN